MVKSGFLAIGGFIWNVPSISLLMAAVLVRTALNLPGVPLQISVHAEQPVRIAAFWVLMRMAIDVLLTGGWLWAVSATPSAVQKAMVGVVSRPLREAQIEALVQFTYPGGSTIPVGPEYISTLQLDGIVHALAQRFASFPAKHGGMGLRIIWEPDVDGDADNTCEETRELCHIPSSSTYTGDRTAYVVLSPSKMRYVESLNPSLMET